MNIKIIAGLISTVVIFKKEEENKSNNNSQNDKFSVPNPSKILQTCNKLRLPTPPKKVIKTTRVKEIWIRLDSNGKK